MDYNYSIVKFRTTLNENVNEVPFAVIVEGRESDKVRIAVVGKNFQPTTKVSRIGKAFVKNAKDILQNQIQIGIKTLNNREVDVSLLDVLAQNNQWTFQVTKPEPIQIDTMSKAHASIFHESMKGKIKSEADREVVVFAITKFFSEIIAGDIIEKAMKRTKAEREITLDKTPIFLYEQSPHNSYSYAQ